MSYAWALMLVPTLIWWKASILWVASMSLYANFVGHYSAYQAARAERKADVAQDTAEDSLSLADSPGEEVST